MADTFAGKRVLLTGAAGFIGSHLTDRLLADGARVTGVDNFITGKKENLDGALKSPDFTLIEADAIEFGQTLADNNESRLPFDFIYHLASPASPPRYQHAAVSTYMVNSMATHYLLTYAAKVQARFLFTSTSEIYGDPLEHPQAEGYFGNVNPIGPRAMYDESKRFGEMVCSVFARSYSTDARMVRIFNTYGPRMDPQDGRVFPTFISQALRGEPITVEGTGNQTRSFCYIDDMVEFLVRAMLVDGLCNTPVNVGNPDEHTILEMATTVRALTQSTSEIVHLKAREEDISKRKPDIERAKEKLGYAPRVPLDEGLVQTIAYFRQTLGLKTS